MDASGAVYVADAFSNRIRKISSEGVVTTLAGGSSGGFADSAGSNASFSLPTGVAVGATSGTVYVAD